LVLDGLPSATIIRYGNEEKVDYMGGIPVGREVRELGETISKIMIYNHLEITVEVHHTLEGHQRIVAFDVEPFSLPEGPDR